MTDGQKLNDKSLSLEATWMKAPTRPSTSMSLASTLISSPTLYQRVFIGRFVSEHWLERGLDWKDNRGEHNTA